MPVWGWVVIAIGALVVIAAIAVVWTRRRTARLQDRFGPEYERVVEEREKRWDAEGELRERERRREELDIQPLPAVARRRYLAAWEETQARFVDSPPAALIEADRLVTQVMRERGYPMDDFDQRAADISVDHPDLVENFRFAHEVSETTKRGDRNTEDMRRAMVHYRGLFDELLGESENGRRRRAG